MGRSTKLNLMYLSRSLESENKLRGRENCNREGGYFIFNFFYKLSYNLKFQLLLNLPVKL